MTKQAQRQGLVKVEGIEGLFSQKTGGNISADSQKQFDGGSLIPDVLASPAESDNITVTRAYDHERDAARVKELSRLVGQWRTTVTITPTTADMIPLDYPDVYPEALLVSMTRPDIDSGSGDFKTFELEFAISQWV